MADKMNVVTENLRAHSSRVDAVVDQLNTALDASQQVTMDNGAYGILCQPFAMLLQPVERNGVEALQKATSTMEEIAENIRGAAEDYQAMDDDNSALINKVQ
ncbi:ESX-1 secretion-associated protein [Saccharopolyspora sp. NPDC000995]